jgi:hypothetical protein
MASFDKISASHIESTANLISGLDLTGMGKDGHAVANLLWAIAAFLRERDL